MCFFNYYAVVVYIRHDIFIAQMYMFSLLLHRYYFHSVCYCKDVFFCTCLIMKVGVWKSKVDRQCIERLKAFQTPPVLVGQVMEMVMMLIGKRLPSQRIQEVREYPGKEDLSSRMSSSSSSTKLIVKKSRSNAV